MSAHLRKLAEEETSPLKRALMMAALTGGGAALGYAGAKTLGHVVGKRVPTSALLPVVAIASMSAALAADLHRAAERQEIGHVQPRQ
jgi:hypothetical protein